MKKYFSRKIYKNRSNFFSRKKIFRKNRKKYFSKKLFFEKIYKNSKNSEFFQKKNFARNDSIRDLEHKNTNDEASKKCFKGLPKRNNETPFQ